MVLTVHRKLNGRTTDPSSGSVRTKLDPPSTCVLALPKLQPLSTPGTDGILLWYSFKHSLINDEHGGHPGERKKRGISLYRAYKAGLITHLSSPFPLTGRAAHNMSPIRACSWDLKFLRSATQSYRKQAPPAREEKQGCKSVDNFIKQFK